MKNLVALGLLAVIGAACLVAKPSTKASPAPAADPQVAAITSLKAELASVQAELAAERSKPNPLAGELADLRTKLEAAQQPAPQPPVPAAPRQAACAPKAAPVVYRQPVPQPVYQRRGLFGRRR